MAAFWYLSVSIFCSSSSFLASRSRLAGSLAAFWAAPKRTSVKLESSKPFAALGRGRAHRLAFAGVLENGMLGGQALLRFVELGGLAIGVLKGLHRADRFVLVRIGGRVVQRLDPVARKHGGIFLRAALGGGDHGAARLLKRRQSSRRWRWWC